MASTFGYTTAAKVRGLATKIVSAVMSDANVEAHITNAENVVNSKVGARYTVPFTSPIPGIIDTLTAELAAYFVMRTQFTGDSQNKSEWQTSFKRAIEQLDAIRDGEEMIVSAAGAELARSSEDVYSTTQAYQPVFDMDEIESSVVDPTLTEDIADARDE